MEYSGIKQLQIIHLSDLHIGDNNIFSIEKSPSGDIPPVGRAPSMFDILKEDLNGMVFDTPTILAITGDLTETGKFEQYQAFEKLLDAFLQDKIIRNFITKDKVFIVPGNHDVLYAESDLQSRTHESYYWEEC